MFGDCQTFKEKHYLWFKLKIEIMAEEENEAKKYSLEENTLLAEVVVLPIMQVIDENVILFNPARARATLKSMKKSQSFAAAWPMPEAQDKSELMSIQNALFEKIIELFELRLEQMHTQQSQTNRLDMLEKLGFNQNI